LKDRCRWESTCDLREKEARGKLEGYEKVCVEMGKRMNSLKAGFEHEDA